MKKKTSLKQIKEMGVGYDVRVSVDKEDGQCVIGLHGMLSSVQRVASQCEGYWVEQGDTGYYLTAK